MTLLHSLFEPEANGICADDPFCLLRDCIVGKPGLTTAELAALGVVDARRIGSALNEMKSLGLVIRSESRVCTVTKRTAATWTPADSSANIMDSMKKKKPAKPVLFNGDDVVAKVKSVIDEIDGLPLEQKVDAINAIRLLLHKKSPFSKEPVDCVLWVPAANIKANDYNPNSVAPPEMKLLEHSIAEDGYTQPIVGWKSGDKIEVVDGFHRNRVGKESKSVRERIHGYLPVTIINDARLDRNDRIASTIRHNRARGKHKVEAMSDIVVELKRRNWTDERICRELGMDQDEVLRLCQITGLSELFSDQDFSKSWDVEGVVTESDFTELSDDVSTYGEEAEGFRTVNTSDESRVFHTFETWECYRAGFYNTVVEGMTKAECEAEYKKLMADKDKFAAALNRIITEWKHSCEHYLTNVAMNRIAWLGQAAVCITSGVSAEFRSGFNKLSRKQQSAADALALEYLNKWLVANGRPVVDMEVATSGSRQSDIY